MKAIYIGLICVCYSLFLLFLSPKDKKNALGYKSFQQNMHKDIWKWTNKCAGILILIGSIIYLSLSVVLELKGISFSAKLNKYGLIYILITIVITECYGLMKRYKQKADNSY